MNKQVFSKHNYTGACTLGMTVEHRQLIDCITHQHRWLSTQMTVHPDDCPPRWLSTQMTVHPDDCPPRWLSTQMTVHPDDCPPRLLSTQIPDDPPGHGHLHHSGLHAAVISYVIYPCLIYPMGSETISTTSLFHLLQRNTSLGRLDNLTTRQIVTLHLVSSFCAFPTYIQHTLNCCMI